MQSHHLLQTDLYVLTMTFWDVRILTHIVGLHDSSKTHVIIRNVEVKLEIKMSSTKTIKLKTSLHQIRRERASPW